MRGRTNRLAYLAELPVVSGEEAIRAFEHFDYERVRQKYQRTTIRQVYNPGSTHPLRYLLSGEPGALHDLGAHAHHAVRGPHDDHGDTRGPPRVRGPGRSASD